jgi:hypothetical protein
MKDFAEQQREAAAIRSDIQKAHSIINDAKTRYIKAKLNVRTKKRTADAAELFAALKDYESKQEIIDNYGWGWITEATRDHLVSLWDEREQHAKDGKIYKDRVVEMVDKAMLRIGDDYQDILYEADDMARENEKNQMGRFQS